MTKSHILGLTLSVCCILVTSSQARRISHRHDVVGPPEGAALDTSGWRPVVDSGRPKLEQVALAPTGYDGDSELVPPPRRSPSLKVKKNRPPHLKAQASETRISTAFTLPPSDIPTSKRPIRFPDDKRRPIRRHRPGSVHLRPYLAQESSHQHVRFRPSPPAPDNIWAEPTEPSVGYFTPQHYNEGPLHLAIAEQHHQSGGSTQQVFGNPAFFNLEQPIRRPQDNAFLEPSVHDNEVLVPHREEVPKYQITDPSSPPPRRRRPRPPPTEETPYIEQEMHRSPAEHEAPAWSTEASVRPRRPKPTTEEPWVRPEEVPEEEEEEDNRRPIRPPAPVQEEHVDDLQRPAFQMRPRKPIATPPVEEQQHQEEVRVRPRRPRPPVQVVQEDLEQEVSSPRPQQEEERPLKRRRPRPPGDNGGLRRRRPKPRPQPVVPAEEEVEDDEQQQQQLRQTQFQQQQQQQQQQGEEDRNAHRQPIQNWPTKEPTTQEVTPENYPENYPPAEEVLEHHQSQQQEEQHSYPEEPQTEQQAEEVPYQQESSEDSFEQHPVSEEANHQQPNEVTSTESLFSIPPKRKRPEVTTPEAAVPTTTPSTTSTALPSTTVSTISKRYRAKLNQTRPRFSLNNIKERLLQQQNQPKDEQQPPAASTEAPKSRFRLGTSTTTEASAMERSTFRPSMSRFTRPPFNSRYRSTTEATAVATTTDHLATRRANADIFNKERRQPLRRRTTEAPVTTTEEMEEEAADAEKEVESTTEQMAEMTTMMPVSSTTPEDFSYARRVTDLTSSATAFNPLSFFSAVPANGKHASQLRFTMATEDPILPIEAFFPAFTSKPAKPHGE